MSDSMETGGFGKNPAIDKINRINTAKIRMSAVTEMEKKIFQPSQPKQRAALKRRKQIVQEFQISFQKGGKTENETILRGGERRLYAGQYPVHANGSRTDRTGTGTAGRILTDGGRKTVQALPVERETGIYIGELQRRAGDGTGHRAEDGNCSNSFRSRGSVQNDKGAVSQIQALSGVSGRGEPLSGRMVSDGNARNRDRTYQSIEYGKGTYDTADVHVSGQGIRKVEEYHSREFQNTERERRQSRWNELVKRM